MAPKQPRARWKRGAHNVEGRQVSQAIIPEIYSRGGGEQCSQGPNPPALPYPAQTGVLAMSVLNDHDVVLNDHSVLNDHDVVLNDHSGLHTARVCGPLLKCDNVSF